MCGSQIKGRGCPIHQDPGRLRGYLEAPDDHSARLQRDADLFAWSKRGVVNDDERPWTEDKPFKTQTAFGTRGFNGRPGLLREPLCRSR